RKSIVFVNIVFLFLFITACSNQDNQSTEGENVGPSTSIESSDVEEDQTSDSDDADETEDEASTGNDDITNAQSQDDMKKLMEQLDFYEFELEVSYGDDKEYEIELEHHSNGDVEAEVEDELNGKDIDDDLEAFNYIYPKVKDLKVSKEMDKQEVIDAVLKAFGLDNNYEEFEVEFEFEDGTKLSFEDKK